MRISDKGLGTGLLVFAVLLMLHVSVGWDWLFNNGFTGFPRAEPGRPGPALFPFTLGILFAVSGLLLLLKGLRVPEPVFRRQAWTRNPAAVFNWLGILAAILVYIWFSELIGFIPLAIIGMTLLMRMLQVRWLTAIASSAVCAGFIHLLFVKFLLVPLPWGFLEPLVW